MVADSCVVALDMLAYNNSEDFQWADGVARPCLCQLPAAALKRHRLVLSDAIAAAGGVKSGLRHMARGKGPSIMFCVFAGRGA